MSALFVHPDKFMVVTIILCLILMIPFCSHAAVEDENVHSSDAIISVPEELENTQPITEIYPEQTLPPVGPPETIIEPEATPEPTITPDAFMQETPEPFFVGSLSDGYIEQIIENQDSMIHYLQFLCGGVFAGTIILLIAIYSLRWLG